ncbi:uncharacterized protein [Euwallacea similis]|uniref:uncharacterized protein n=1 Tax=Euwallacea similis TaxID=1736056 RepID=UPI00344B8375
MDLKSPSEQIGRSPLEELSVATLKLANLSIESLETDIPALETPLKHHLVLDVESRFPNVEVHSWSPVIVRASPDKEFSAIIRDKNLEKVKNLTEVCSEVIKSTDQCRAPLRLKKGEEVKDSNMDRLKVRNKPRKQVKVSSKIPIFKGKKVKVQCDNIPPRNMMPNISSSKKTVES